MVAIKAMGTLHPSKGGLFQGKSDALSVRQACCRVSTPARASAQEQAAVKTAVITGGTRGIGFAIAKSLARSAA